MSKKPKFTFIDLFAGIGGMRQAFEARGGKCVFSSEWDKFAQQTYQANFGEKPHGDITQIPSSVIPRHDILIAGFPCQPFSHAGLKKGFMDTIKGSINSMFSSDSTQTNAPPSYPGTPPAQGGKRRKSKRKKLRRKKSRKYGKSYKK